MSRFWVPLALALLSPVLRAEDAFNLLKFMEPQTNCVAVVNTQGILASPRAQKEGWAKLAHTEYLAGAVPLNPKVERMLFAKEIVAGSPGEGDMYCILVTMQPFEAAKIAAIVGGKEATVGGETVVLDSTGNYFFKIGDNLMGALRGDTKQDLVKWLKFIKTAKESQLAKVLNAAVANSANNHITLCLDAEELFEERDVEIAVALSKATQAVPDQVEPVTAFFKKLKGVTFTANIMQNGIVAKIRFESSHQALKLDADAAKAFIMDTLGNHGAMLQDMGTAKATKAASDASVTLEFMISDGELGRIMSVMLPPAALPPADSITVASDKPNADATLKYFNAVNAIVDDLKAQNKKANDYTKTALWHETAASKIDMLSTIGVDKSIVEYGQGTAQRLQTIADSLRGVPAKVEELAGQAYALGYMPRRGLYGGGRGRINPWAFGNANIQTNAGEIANKQAKVVKDDEKNRDKLWAAIDGKRSETRGMIVEKYKVVPPEKK